MVLKSLHTLPTHHNQCTQKWRSQSTHCRSTRTYLFGTGHPSQLHSHGRRVLPVKCMSECRNSSTLSPNCEQKGHKPVVSMSCLWRSDKGNTHNLVTWYSCLVVVIILKHRGQMFKPENNMFACKTNFSCAAWTMLCSARDLSTSQMTPPLCHLSRFGRVHRACRKCKS